ncbi:MAG: hypothetical protein Q8Q02_12875 [Nocardioides sp.]|nr:hypothetical protein [Nocardioides sp.]
MEWLRRWGARRALLAVLVLPGLFVMHGLGDHGSPGSPAHAAAPMLATGSSLGEAPAAGSAPHPGAAVVDHHTSEHLGNMHGVAIALCLAVLVLVATATTRVVARGWPVAATLARARPAFVDPARRRPRRRHPPPYALRVIRC